MPLPIIISLIAILITLIGLLFAVRNYDRKAGIAIRGDYTIGFSRACNDGFVKSITLENTKDKSITIFAIYLRLGYNNYIEVDDFGKDPLIIKAFETFKKDYGPIEFHSYNLYRLNIRRLLSDLKLKKQLILSTSQGKYKVPRLIDRWNPYRDYFFINHLTTIVKPIRSVINGQAIGCNVAYAIKFVSDNDEEKIVPIQADDYKLRIFTNFNISKKDLASKTALESLIKTQISNGNLKCKSYEIFDMELWRKQHYNIIFNYEIPATTYGCFKYYVIGKIETIMANCKNNYLRRKKIKGDKQLDKTAKL